MLIGHSAVLYMSQIQAVSKLKLTQTALLFLIKGIRFLSLEVTHHLLMSV
jgi:hypothetical protein